jgi:hypothetical protein
MHMEDPIKRLFLISHYIYACTLKVYLLYPYVLSHLANIDLSVEVLTFLQILTLALES